MKALSIWQPWASLSAGGCKNYEFRTWRPPEGVIGERIVLHAAQKACDGGQAHALRSAIRSNRQSVGMLCFDKLDAAETILGDMLRGNYPRGAGLATAMIGEPRPIGDVAAEFGVKHTIYRSPDGKPLWAWPLLEIEKWDVPLPACGKQGLWRWPKPEDFCL